MKKYIELPATVDIITYPKQTVVAIALGLDAIRDWCLAICLLREGLANSAVIVPTHGRYKLELRVSKSSAEPSVVQGGLKAGLITLTMGRATCDYVMVSCLRYYRDGYAAVDHLDVEATLVGLGEGSYVTVKFADSAPSVSAEEAGRRLGG